MSGDDTGPAPAKKPHRPKAAKDKRKHAMFRMSERIHAQVWAAAEENGRSLSEEVEHRIVQSIEMPSVIQAAATAAADAAMRQSEIAAKDMLFRVYGGEDGFDAAVMFALRFGKVQRAVDKIVEDGRKWYESEEKIARIEDSLQTGTKRFVRGLANDLKALRANDKK